MQPSPEAIEWGKRQASRSPRWSDAKWKSIGTILGVELTDTAEHQTDQNDDHQADAATRDAA